MSLVRLEFSEIGGKKACAKLKKFPKLKDFLLNSSTICPKLRFSENFDNDKTEKVARSAQITIFVNKMPFFNININIFILWAKKSASFRVNLVSLKPGHPHL